MKRDTIVKKDGSFISVWIDEAFRPCIEQIEGVTHINEVNKNNFYVFIDPRYSMDEIIEEIKVCIGKSSQPTDGETSFSAKNDDCDWLMRDRVMEIAERWKGAPETAETKDIDYLLRLVTQQRGGEGSIWEQMSGRDRMIWRYGSMAWLASHNILGGLSNKAAMLFFKWLLRLVIRRDVLLPFPEGEVNCRLSHSELWDGVENENG
jgi:hypothetical protein